MNVDVVLTHESRAKYFYATLAKVFEQLVRGQVALNGVLPPTNNIENSIPRRLLSVWEVKGRPSFDFSFVSKSEGLEGRLTRNWLSDEVVSRHS